MCHCLNCARGEEWANCLLGCQKKVSLGLSGRKKGAATLSETVQEKTRLKVSMRVLLAVVLVFAVVFACCLLWQHTLLPALRSADWGEGFDVPRTEVPVDLSVLPPEPTERDFAHVAVQLLDSETGFTTFRPVFVMWTMLCGSDVYTPTEVVVWASWSTSGTPPPQQSLSGRVWLWPQRNKAEIEIQGYYGASSSYTAPSLDQDELRWHVDDLLFLAEKQGGQEYRQAVQDRCEITLRSFSFEPTWLVEYRPLEEREGYFCMTMERQTGVYTATVTATECEW